MPIRPAIVVLSLLALALLGHPSSDVVVARSLQAPQQQDELALALRNPATHYRLAIPEFVVAGDAELATAARTVAEVLWNDIDFEREFFMITRKASTAIPAARADALPFDRWAELADFVLVGEASRRGAEMTVQVRLISVRADNRGRQLFGREYPNCRPQNPRLCAHSIADDFHKEVRQVDGVARTKLAFSSDRDASRVTGRPSQTSGQGKEIYISDYDGAGQARLTVNRSLNLMPNWAPNGGLLAYTSYVSGFPDIYVANLAAPGRALGRPAGGTERVHNQFAAWSPDGRRLAFTSNRSGNYDIWVVNSDGTGLQNLTNFPAADDLEPTWSPDGGQIAFISDRAGTNQLYVMNSVGTAQRRLVDQKTDRPTWSVKNFIAFTVGSGPGHDIGIYDFNTPGGVKILTDGNGSNESPAVAPNGRHIAFFTTRWGKKQIAVIDSDGTHLRQLTEAGNNEFPNWQPIVGR